ncbi:MAG: CHC2 zinc finger domain-containing protein, partial [Nanopusillaceae archaeon]
YRGFNFYAIHFQYDSERKKVQKKPVASWKEEASCSWVKRVKEHYKTQSEIIFGLAIRLEDFENLVVIDIDDVEKFSEFYPLDNFLEEIREDAVAIVKSISRGYHIYLWYKDFPDANNKTLLERKGFEIKKKGLLVIPPSAYVQNGLNLSTQVLYVNKENLNKEPQVRSKALKAIIDVIYDLKEEEEKEKLAQSYEKACQIAKDLTLEKEKEDFRSIITLIKQKVRFIDLIGEYFVRAYGKYDLYHCPFHPPDRSPSFAVYHTPYGELAIDFHDNRRFDIIDLHKELHRTTFIQAVKELAKKAGLEINEDLFKPKKTAYSDGPLSLENAFYTQIVQYLQIQKSKKGYILTCTGKRYCMHKKKKEIWEVKEFFYQGKKGLFETICNNPFDVLVLQNNEEFFQAYFYQPQTLIIEAIITEGIAYETGNMLSLSLPTSYSLSLQTKQKTLEIDNCNIEVLLNKLKTDGYITNIQKARDAISKIINDLRYINVIQTKVGSINSQGFFYSDSEESIITSEFPYLEKGKITIEHLKESLAFLEVLTEYHFMHILSKWNAVLKWFLVAPFSFAIKQKTKQAVFVPALYLYGASGTGKSTLALVLSKIWAGLTRIDEKTGANADTIARLGKTLSTSTFPVIISEPQGALSKEDILEAIKNALTNIRVRGTYAHGEYKDIPALANIVFTSNYFVPQDDSFIRRVYLINFSLKERPMKNENWEKNYKEIERLKAIGLYILENLSEFEPLIWEIEKHDFQEVGEKILAKLYAICGQTLPEIFQARHTQEFNLEENEKEISFMVNRAIVEAFVKAGKQHNLNTDNLEKLILNLAKQNALPEWCVVHNDKIFFTSRILVYISDKKIAKFSSLKHLGELLDMDFGRLQIKNKIDTPSAISLPLKEFIERVNPESVDFLQDGEWEAINENIPF